MSRPGGLFLVIDPMNQGDTQKQVSAKYIDEATSQNNNIQNNNTDATRNNVITNTTEIANSNEKNNMSNNEDDLESLCRVCAEEQVAGIPFCNEFGEHFILRDKISKYLQFQVSLDDELPKIICMDCCVKLESFSVFVNNAQNAQKVLRTRLDLRKNCKVLSRDDKIMISKFNKRTSNDKPAILRKEQLYDQLDDDVTIRLIKPVKDCSIVQNNSLSSPRQEDVLLIEQYNDRCSEEEKNELTEFTNGLCREDITKFNMNITKRDVEKFPILKPKRIKKTKVQLDKNTAHHCHYCDRNFCSDLALKGHMWSHDNRNATCKICNSFVDPSSNVCLNGMCELSGNTCQICGRPFKSKTKLREHFIRHTTAKMFACNICGMRCKRERQLKIHMNLHTGERPFKCGYCPATFHHPSNSHNHRLRMHPNEPGLAPHCCPNKCFDCGKSFKKKTLLLDHMKSHELTPADLAETILGQT